MCEFSYRSLSVRRWPRLVRNAVGSGFRTVGGRTPENIIDAARRRSVTRSAAGSVRWRGPFVSFTRRAQRFYFRYLLLIRRVHAEETSGRVVRSSKKPGRFFICFFFSFYFCSLSTAVSLPVVENVVKKNVDPFGRAARVKNAFR